MKNMLATNECTRQGGVAMLASHSRVGIDFTSAKNELIWPASVGWRESRHSPGSCRLQGQRVLDGGGAGRLQSRRGHHRLVRGRRRSILRSSGHERRVLPEVNTRVNQRVFNAGADSEGMEESSAVTRGHTDRQANSLHWYVMRCSGIVREHEPTSMRPPTRSPSTRPADCTRGGSGRP